MEKNEEVKNCSEALLKTSNPNSTEKTLTNNISSKRNSAQSITSEPQPSIPLETNVSDSIKTKNNFNQKFEDSLSFVNYKRGDEFSLRKQQKPKKDSAKSSSSLHSLQISQVPESSEFNIESVCDSSSQPDNNLRISDSDTNDKCLSLEMIDQQIRNEDIQLDHFTTLLNIRAKALQDRTKGELAWLQITKK